MTSPPILVSKTNVMIGYNPIYEYAALPDTDRIAAAIRRSMSTRTKREPVAAAASRGPTETTHEPQPTTVATTSPPGRSQIITVPIMGEGIRAAKVVALLKKPGEQIELDDPLCELETDKAVYPVESSFAGVMGEWKTKVGDDVEIGQELGTIAASGADLGDQMQAGTGAVHSQNGSKSVRQESQTSTREPALSPTITRKLSRVIPANLQIDARWTAISKAREQSKRRDGKNGASPSVMIAWAVVRAMEKHAPFRRLALDDDSIVENANFDLGIAVALEGDRLATAVITNANQKSWTEFATAYRDVVDKTRTGRVDAMNAPVVISSLGAFGVRAAAPIVVPPSVATLFVGTAHNELLPSAKKNETAEVITLSLTFDHRVVNGAGAANFVRDIANEIESFTVPTEKAATK